MKNLIFNTTCILILSFLFLGCKKENSITKNKQGVILVSLDYDPGSSNSIYTYGQTTVKLYSGGILLSERFASQSNSNIDFGSYDYGDYMVEAYVTVTKTTVSSGNTVQNYENEKRNFTLNSKDKNISITLSFY